MRNNLIILKDYCDRCHVEPSFIDELFEDGLIQLEEEDHKKCIRIEELDELDRYARLHYDLSINIEGLDAIHHLLNRMDELQHEIKILENELNFYRTF